MAASKRFAKKTGVVSPLAIDPVCGMAVAPDAPTRSVEHREAHYVFCSDGCRTKFLAEPARYIDGTHDNRPGGPIASGRVAVWTCPMHPEIRRAHPGGCPICGMALEPAEPLEGVEPNPELLDFTQRFLIGAILAVPLLLLAMGQDMTTLPIVPMSRSPWIQLGLSAPIVLWAEGPFFRRAWTSLRSRHLNMFTLVAIGVGTAFGYSVVATLAPFLFPAALHERGTVPVYYEAAGVVVVLVLLGQVLELRARAATGRAIQALIALAPKIAWRIDPDGSEERIALGAIAEGDRLHIRPGEAVPVDGIVLDGRSTNALRLNLVSLDRRR